MLLHIYLLISLLHHALASPVASQERQDVSAPIDLALAEALQQFISSSPSTGMPSTGMPSIGKAPQLIAPKMGTQHLFSAPVQSPLSYAIGTPVLTTNVTLYNIFYGTWADGQVEDVQHFSRHLFTSPWWDITTKYYAQDTEDGPRTYISSDVRVAPACVVRDHALGKELSDTAIPELIQDLVDRGLLPEDGNALYSVITSGDVKESMRYNLGMGAGFCEAYCGYHASWTLLSGKRIYYSFAGVPMACLDSCAMPYLPTRAGKTLSRAEREKAGLASLYSVLAHEFTEAWSDPWADEAEHRSWNDAMGQENGYAYCLVHIPASLLGIPMAYL
jgi:hypothetical protein